MADSPNTLPTLPPDVTAHLTDFARACKAALRAVSLYPAAHPAIGATLSRLTEITTTLTATGPFSIHVHPQTLFVDDAAPAKPDPAIVELAELLRRQLIGEIVLNGGADAESWRTLLTLFSRAPEEIRADGGIAHLWAAAGGPSVELREIDYAEVLREKQGDAATIDRVIEAALAGKQMEMDDSGMRVLLEILGDPQRLAQLMAKLASATAKKGVDVKVAAFLNLLRGLTEHVSRTNPGELDGVLRQVSHAAGQLSADSMLALLAQRGTPAAVSGSVNVVTAVVQRMDDSSVAHFVSSSVVEERGATERLAEAFQTLVPELDRQRQLLGIAQEEVAATPFGQEENFAELWERVEKMLVSYSDSNFVSSDYARELTSARTRPVDVEATSDDPPERVASWLATVSDASLRALDYQLLADLVVIEPDAARWRDIADTVMHHAEDLVRVGFFDQAWQLAESVVTEAERMPVRRDAARAVLEEFGRGAMMKHVPKHLRTADDAGYERFKHVCHAIGPAVIPPLAEVLAAEQDARSRRRLRDILVGFGAAGKESVQQLMNATNWEVRRTAAYLLREFGGTEALSELQPLLVDREPLVQREAIRALILSGTEAASQMLLRALTTVTGRPRETLINELSSLRDERAAPLFCHLVRHLDRAAFHAVYVSAIEALGSYGGPEAVEALKEALQQGDVMAPFQTRRARAAAAQALRRIGNTAAIEALRDAATHGSLGVRNAAKSELGRM